MSKHIDLGEAVKKALGAAFPLTKNDVGADSRLKARGTTLETESYQVSGFGHLCILRMRAMMGMMKMETVVMASYEIEMPLLNLDWVQAMGKETQIIEYYDDRVEAFDKTLIKSFKDSGKGKTDEFNQTVAEELAAFVKQMKTAEAAPLADKASRVKRYAEALFHANGPAVSQIVKLFGEETSRRLVVKHMYGGQ